jgi:hypothetical protein
MLARHPFSKSEIQVMVVIHAALMAGVAAFGGVALTFAFMNRGIGPGVIPDFVTLVAYANVVLPLLALAASRAYLKAKVNRACERLRDRSIHIEGFKRKLRSAYLFRAAIMEFPALLGLTAVLIVALGPGDIFAAPSVHLANFLGAVVFLIETARVTPTESRLDELLRVHDTD